MSAHGKRMVRLAKLAKEYRAENPTLPAGGAVIFWRMKATGWICTLDEPQRFAPGAIAVVESGQVFEATGGEYMAGAKEWSSIFDPSPIPAAPFD